MRGRVSHGLIAWMVLSLVGVLIVLAPDEGRRVFSFSEDHGPSAQDLVGIIVILIGWLAFLIPLLESRVMIWRPGWLMFVALAGAGLLVWSVATDTELGGCSGSCCSLACRSLRRSARFERHPGLQAEVKLAVLPDYDNTQSELGVVP
jgi:drug/metabolite transporter (DMT)-like permease